MPTTKNAEKVVVEALSKTSHLNLEDDLFGFENGAYILVCISLTHAAARIESCPTSQTLQRLWSGSQNLEGKLSVRAVYTLSSFKSY